MQTPQLCRACNLQLFCPIALICMISFRTRSDRSAAPKTSSAQLQENSQIECGCCENLNTSFIAQPKLVDPVFAFGTWKKNLHISQSNLRKFFRLPSSSPFSAARSCSATAMLKSDSFRSFSFHKEPRKYSGEIWATSLTEGGSVLDAWVLKGLWSLPVYRHMTAGKLMCVGMLACLEKIEGLFWTRSMKISIRTSTRQIEAMFSKQFHIQNDTRISFHGKRL